jgi:hypothetical protein
MNVIPTAAAVGAPILAACLACAVWYWFSPWYTDVGYQPRQPVENSHMLHAGELGIDCRYCHNTVEIAAAAAIPPTGTCMNCHKVVLPESDEVIPLRESLEAGTPIEWIRVHMLPDYAYFDHSVHFAAGVGCVECHGRVDQMEVLTQQMALGMGWCLDCHRNPAPRLRPRDEVVSMAWSGPYDPEADPTLPHAVDPPVHCSGCHR